VVKNNLILVAGLALLLVQKVVHEPVFADLVPASPSETSFEGENLDLPGIEDPALLHGSLSVYRDCVIATDSTGSVFSFAPIPVIQIPAGPLPGPRSSLTVGSESQAQSLISKINVRLSTGSDSGQALGTSNLYFIPGTNQSSSSRISVRTEAFSWADREHLALRNFPVFAGEQDINSSWIVREDFSLPANWVAVFVLPVWDSTRSDGLRADGTVVSAPSSIYCGFYQPQLAIDWLFKFNGLGVIVGNALENSSSASAPKLIATDAESSARPLGACSLSRSQPRPLDVGVAFLLILVFGSIAVFRRYIATLYR